MTEQTPTEPTALRPRSERCPEPECQAGGECWRCDYEESQAARTTPAPAPELRDQIAAAIREATVRLASIDAFAEQLTDAVLAVPAIRALTETRNALRHATGDRDAALAEEQQLRALLELAQDGAKGWREECGKAVRRIERVQSAAESDPPLEKFMGEEPTEYARGWASAMAAIEAALNGQPSTRCCEARIGHLPTCPANQPPAA